jgi:hypothetical protein
MVSINPNPQDSNEQPNGSFISNFLAAAKLHSVTTGVIVALLLATGIVVWYKWPKSPAGQAQATYQKMLDLTPGSCAAVKTYKSQIDAIERQYPDAVKPLKAKVQEAVEKQCLPIILSSIKELRALREQSMPEKAHDLRAEVQGGLDYLGKSQDSVGLRPGEMDLIVTTNLVAFMESVQPPLTIQNCRDARLPFCSEPAAKPVHAKRSVRHQQAAAKHRIQKRAKRRKKP